MYGLGGNPSPHHQFVYKVSHFPMNQEKHFLTLEASPLGVWGKNAIQMQENRVRFNTFWSKI